MKLARTSQGTRKLAALLILLFFASLLVLPAGTGMAAGIEYDRVVTRYYRSSVDGTLLPCYVYVPYKPGKLPLWVDLHTFGSYGGISEKMAQAASSSGCIILSPWGRNYHSFYADCMEKPETKAPSVFDDFTGNNASGWSAAIGSQWAAADDAYRQSDWSDSWKAAVRSGTGGFNYSVSADVTPLEVSEGDGNREFAAGLMVRRQANGDCYMVDLDRDYANVCWVRTFKYAGGGWTLLGRLQLPEYYDPQGTHNLKVTLYGDNIEVHVDNLIAGTVQDSTFTSGDVGLVSYGARHSFDNVRVQNDMLYGETDTLDCVYQCMEELSSGTPVLADPARVFISGSSMGGGGAWNLGLHYPDLFAFIHPGYGSTDIIKGYDWIRSRYPDQDGSFWVREQDSTIAESIVAANGGYEPGSDTRLNSGLHEYSARYLLENALNTPVRIEHPEYDSLVPNTTNSMVIKWRTIYDSWIAVAGAASDYAHSQAAWQTWANTPGLTRCTPETSMYDPATGAPGPGVPTLGIWDNTDYTRMADYTYGAHCAVVSDSSLAAPVLQSFNRLYSVYGRQHLDPDDVAYRTYDSRHNGSWWLAVEAAFPDQDRPALARAHRDRTANSAAVHAKNAKKITLDLMLAGLDCTAGRLTMTVDGNTAPESEFKVQDDYRKTDLRLVGDWTAARKAEYQVTMDGAPVAFDMTSTALTVPNVDTTTLRTITITPPAGAGSSNLMAAMNPGFESGTSGWTALMDGPMNGVFALNQDAPLVHTGAGSIRIKDPAATSAPYRGFWISGNVQVQAGKNYTLSAFARTRALNTNARTYANGVYDPASDSNAAVAVVWLRSDGSIAGWNNSVGIHGTGGWTPLEVSAKAPGDAAQARAVLYTVCPNAGGIAGSAWFDDVSLKAESDLSVSSIAPATATNAGAVNAAITGSGFQAGAGARLEQGSTVVNATGVSVAADGRSLTCSFDLTSRPVGKYDVVVRNPDGHEARMAAGFEVTQPSSGCGAGASISVFAAFGLLSLAGFGFGRRRERNRAE